MQPMKRLNMHFEGQFFSFGKGGMIFLSPPFPSSSQGFFKMSPKFPTCFPKMFPIAPQFYPIYIDHNITYIYISWKHILCFYFVEGNIYKPLCCGMLNVLEKLVMGQSMWLFVCVIVIFMMSNIGCTYVYVPLYKNIGTISTHVYQLIN
jgi:hypothetical protein